MWAQGSVLWVWGYAGRKGTCQRSPSAEWGLVKRARLFSG